MSGNYYPDNQVFDLRLEMSAILGGDENNPGIGQKVLIRRMSNKSCTCWDGFTGSPDENCAYCDGEGFLWFETLNTVYIARNFGNVLNSSTVIQQQDQIGAAGVMDQNRAVAYCQYSIFLDFQRYLDDQNKIYDKLYELDVDAAGRLITPAVRMGKWKILSFTAHRGDYGRVEWLELGLSRESL